MASLSDVLKSIEKISGSKSLMQGVEVKDVERIPMPMVSVNRMLYGEYREGEWLNLVGKKVEENVYSVIVCWIVSAA